MQNKVKSEQSFAVTSAKRVAFFQASLKLVREEAGAQLSNNDNKCSISQEIRMVFWGVWLIQTQMSSYLD